MQKNLSQKNKSRVNLFYRINILSCYFIIAWMTLPYVRTRVGTTFMLGFFVLWIISTDIRWITKKWSFDLIFVFVFFITFIPYLISGSLNYGDAGSRIVLVQFPLFFVGIFINHYYLYYKKDYKALSKMVIFTLITFIIGSTQTYIGLLQNPLASRILATGVNQFEAEKAFFYEIGVGGYGYIYAANFFCIGLIYLILRNNNRINMTKKSIVILVFITSILMIIQASYAIAFVILFSGTLLVLFVKNKKMLILAITIFLIAFIVVPQTFIGNFLLEIAFLFKHNSVINEKFLDLGMQFLQDLGRSQTRNRIDLYILSIKAFINQPLFGIYGPFGSSLFSVGAHSGWLDLLGLYGLFAGIPLFFTIYFNFRKHLKFYNQGSYYGYLVVIYFLFLLLGTINPILYIFEIGFTIFFVIPILPLMIYRVDEDCVS